MQWVNSDSDKLGLCAPGPLGVIFWPSLPYLRPLMLRDRNILLCSTAVTPEIKGSTRAPVLRRGGRTDRGLAPGVDRVKSAGVTQIHRPLPFPDEWGGLEGASDLRSLGARG